MSANTSARWRTSRSAHGATALAFAVFVLAGLALASLLLPAPQRAAAAAGLAAGVGVALAAYVAFVHLHLSRAGAACRRVRSGDLSHTIPARGPTSLRVLAETINDMAADFQEVLLLFAHLSRSARAAADILRTSPANRGAEAPPARVSEIVQDIEEMERTIKDFHYFRVIVENGSIRDTAIRRAGDRGNGRGDAGGDAGRVPVAVPSRGEGE